MHHLAHCLALALLCSCQSIDTQGDLALDASFSALPNLGVALGASQVFTKNAERSWSFELEMTSQPFDDEDLSDDGNPHAGDWTQFQLGAKRLSAPTESRHWTKRLGIAWFRARGPPNIVQEAGDYIGVYGGYGFETHFAGQPDGKRGISMGPELSLMLARGEGAGGDVVVVPQLNWHISWGF